MSVVTMESETRKCEGAGRLEGRYANHFEIGHNAFEFLFDMGQAYPEGEQAHIHTRIVTGPKYAKALCELLSESIDRYERTFGAIQKD